MGHSELDQFLTLSLGCQKSGDWSLICTASLTAADIKNPHTVIIDLLLLKNGLRILMLNLDNLFVHSPFNHFLHLILKEIASAIGSLLNTFIGRA